MDYSPFFMSYDKYKDKAIKIIYVYHIKPCLTIKNVI